MVIFCFLHFGYSKDHFYLNESSCDTIYRVTPRTGEVIPGVIKMPPILSYDNSLRHFLYVVAETLNYVSFYKLTVKQQPNARPSYKATYYFYDKADKQIYEELAVLPFVKEGHNPFALGHISSFTTYGETIYAYQFIEEVQNGNFTGELKAMVDSMNEEDNPIIRILTAK